MWCALLQPHLNIRTQWLGNSVVDGLGSPHAGVATTPANAFKEPVQFGNAAFTVQGAQRGADGVMFDVPMTRLIVWHGNTITGQRSARGPWLCPTPPHTCMCSARALQKPCLHVKVVRRGVCMQPHSPTQPVRAKQPQSPHPLLPFWTCGGVVGLQARRAASIWGKTTGRTRWW